MTHRVVGISAAALGMGAMLSLSPVASYADTPASATPSLAEPAPTPGWAEGGASSAGDRTPTASSHRPHVAARHVARRAARGSDNPVGDVATGVVGGVADLGSMAAYPFYCFPHYGSCPVRMPYRP